MPSRSVSSDPTGSAVNCRFQANALVDLFTSLYVFGRCVRLSEKETSVPLYPMNILPAASELSRLVCRPVTLTIAHLRYPESHFGNCGHPSRCWSR